MPEPYTIELPPYRASLDASSIWLLPHYGGYPYPPPAIITGGSSALGDNSDSTYADFVYGERLGGFDGGAYSRQVIARFPAINVADHVPAGWTGYLSIPWTGLRVRSQPVTEGYDFYGAAPFANFDVALASYSAILTEAIGPYVLGINFFTDTPGISTVSAGTWLVTSGAYLLPTWAAAGDLGVSVNRGIIDRVYDVWIEGVTIYAVPPTTPPVLFAPPLRQFPRDDGMGASPGLRHWPTPRSLQHGNRRGGSVYP